MLKSLCFYEGIPTYMTEKIVQIWIILKTVTK